MLSPRPSKDKRFQITDLPPEDQLAFVWRKIRSLWRFAVHTISRRRRVLLGLGVYLLGAYMLFSVPLRQALLPLELGVLAYAVWWTGRRRKQVERLGRNREPVARLPLAWWLERRRVDHVRYRWEQACYGHALVRGGDNFRSKNKHRAYPRPLKITTDPDRDVRIIANPGAVQVPVSKVKQASDHICETVGCREVVVRDTGTKGVVEICFYWRSPLDRVIRLHEIPLSPNKRMLSIGITRDGGPFTIPKHMSMAVTGMPGSGKSNFLQGLIASYLADGDWVEVYVLDLKGGVEFQYLEPLVGKGWRGHLKVSAYCSDDVDAQQPNTGLIAQVRRRMQELQALARSRGVLSFTKSTQETPYVLLLVDETKRIPYAMADKSPTGNKMNKDLDHILSQGRALQVLAVFATQDARTETLPGTKRTMVPTRIGFATDNMASTHCALGDKAESEQGAKCSELRPFIDAGRFYARCIEMQSADKNFQPGRTAMVTEAEIAQIVRTGTAPKAMLARHPYDAPRPCALYRVWEFPDAAGQRRLGYIGECWVSDPDDPTRSRFLQHRDSGERKNLAWCPEHRRVENWWLTHIDESTVRVEMLPSKREAQSAEASAIKGEKPYWNRRHNLDNLQAAINRHRPSRTPVVKTQPQLELVPRRRPDFRPPPADQHWGGE